MGIGLKFLMRSLADLAMPRICICCGRTLLLHEDRLCTPCLADFPLTRFRELRDNPMARSFNELINKDASKYEPFSCATALFFYSGVSPYRKITRALKYRRDFAAGRHFARMLGRDTAASPLFSDVKLVIPVPLHWRRRLARGYNQAEIIAQTLAKEYPRECRPALAPWLLERRRKTGSQALLHGRDERFANVKSAFRVPERGLRRLRKIQVRQEGLPLHLLLVDDVYTTGATLAACHAALRAALGPSVRISAATLAYVGQ